MGKIKMKKSFVEHLETSLAYIGGYVASQIIFQLLECGAFDLLKTRISPDELSAQLSYKKPMVVAILEYLEREDIVFADNTTANKITYELTEKGRMISEQRGWFEMLVGGYGPIFGAVDEILKNGPEAAKRNGALVGRGSCNISRYDSIPLTKKLIKQVAPEAKTFIDFGCGNSLYLCTFCEETPGITAIGIDPSEGAIEEGKKIIKQKHLDHRISLIKGDAINYNIPSEPDVIMFCFVLHELYGQHGRSAVVDYLSNLGAKFPHTSFIVVEVDYNLTNESVLKSKVGLGYYNPYFLLHPFTGQQLLSDIEWRQIFSAAGFDIIKAEVVDPEVDPTGLEIGYALKYIR